MYATGNKKMLNMLILEILKEYSDEKHRISQQEVIRLLKSNYGIECDRRSVKNNILCLKELGYEISMENGYYLMEREFEDSELRMLIDSVLFSKTLTQKQAKQLIEKLKRFGNRYFPVKVSHVCNLPELHHGDNKQLVYSVDTVNEAITLKHKIAFIYNSYGTDLKLHPRREEEYIVNPYQMVANNGRFYLIANYDKYDEISHFRLDRMTSVRILDQDVKPMNQVKGLEHGLDLPKHMAEHIYMSCGESALIKILTTKSLINDLVDWFGKDFDITDEKEDGQIEVHLRCNINAFYYWALQFGPYLEVLEPVLLRRDIAKAVRAMDEKYNGKRQKA